MAELNIQVEQLDNGLRAAFVNLPHFRTHSARLIVNAGSMHESAESLGSAHFLEHVTFQGTDELPTEAAVHAFAERHGLSQNAVTSRVNTTYLADGSELDAVSTFVSQVALHPKLENETLEKERMPIVDEIRKNYSDPHYMAGATHSRAMRGELFARPITGSMDDVKQLSPDELRGFHERNYRLANAILVICSAEPIEKQRDIAEALIKPREVGIAPINDAPITLDNFNPENKTSSLQTVDLPMSAQTNIGIHHQVPEVDSDADNIGYNVVGTMLAKQAHNRLRREMAVCYSASADVYRLFDLNYERNKNWAQLSSHASLNGTDAVAGLDSLYNDVLHKEIPESVYDSVMIQLKRDLDRLLESGPAVIAGRVSAIASTLPREEIDLAGIVNFADSVSIDFFRGLHRKIVESKPLITATSPDPEILSAVGEWADSIAS